MESPCFCMFLIIFGWSRLTKHHVCLASKSQQPIATQAAPAVPAVPGNCPAEEDNAVCLDFFCALHGIYCDILSCIEIYWDTVNYCDCLWMFMLDDFDSFWWFVMAGYGWHMYDHVWKCKICHGRGPNCGGARNVYNLHLLKFTFGFFPQSLKLHGIAMFWMFLIVFDYFWQAPIMPFHAWSKCQQPRPHQQYQRERTMQCAQLCWEFLGTLCRIVKDIFWYIWILWWFVNGSNGFW